MKLRLLAALAAGTFVVVPSADAAWQTGATYDGAKTQICSAPKADGQISIRHRVDARNAGSGYDPSKVAMGGLFRVRGGKAVYDYEKEVRTMSGQISATRSIFFARTAQLDAWIGNRISMADRKRYTAANVTRC